MHKRERERGKRRRVVKKKQWVKMELGNAGIFHELPPASLPSWREKEREEREREREERVRSIYRVQCEIWMLEF